MTTTTLPPSEVVSASPAVHVIGDAVDELLARFLSAQEASLSAVDPALRQLTRAARDAVLSGGKRLRPTFAYWGWRGVVGAEEPLASVLPALAALELLHTFALVHDDVMDDSSTRRGRPTVHRALAAEHEARGLRGVAERFGRSGAILVGDLCLIWADQLLGRSALPSAGILAARAVYDRMRVETVAGQFLDILGESHPSWSVQRALRVIRYKTAQYTVARPLQYGAALAGPAPEEITRRYASYGRAVGEAFQLRDDLLDVYGDAAVTGKAVGQDLACARPTVLLELARAMAGRSQRAELERRLSTGDTERAAVLISEIGAADRVRSMIDERVAAALDNLRSAPIDAAARIALADLAVASARRTA